MGSFKATFQSLVSLLQARASKPSGEPDLTFLSSDGAEDCLDFSGLDLRARAIGATLQDLRARGERVLLLYPPGLDYVAAFFGSLYGETIAVPAYPPDPLRLQRTLPRLRAIVEDARASIVLTTEVIQSLAGSLAELAPELAGLRWIATDTLDPATATAWRPVSPSPDALAFLQYTSGSTGGPKGVMLSHGNLLANLEAIRVVFEHDEQSHNVIWLPPYHDMGLIGGILQPIYANYPMALMAPMDFLRRPALWLEAISKYRGTTCGAPNFAFDLCVRKVPPEARAGLDLSSWQVAFCGAEPIRADTFARFAKAFAPCGFRPEALYPCYGLAEVTLLAAGSRRLTRAKQVAVDAVKLEQGLAVERHGEGPARTLVSCGRVVPQHTMLVIHPERQAVCAPGEIGEIWLSGPSIAQGYWGKEEDTARTFRAQVASHPGLRFLRTGDLGFVRDDELFITGRLKDLIILRGRNHYPQDIEQTVECSHRSVRPGGVAAFPLEIEGEERLGIVAELARPEDVDRPEVIAAVRQAVEREHDLRVDMLVLVPPGSIPKTSSGKIQRRACREALVGGTLELLDRSELSPDEPEVGPALDAAALRALPASERRAALEEAVRLATARALRVPAATLSCGLALSAQGIDSLTAVELAGALGEQFGVELPAAALLEEATIDRLADQILQGMGSPHAAPMPRARESNPEVEFPLTPGQAGLYFLNQRSPDTSEYNISVALAIHGELNAGALQAALGWLAARHSALRAIFGNRDGVPFFRIAAEPQLELVQHEARSWDDATLQRRLNDEANRPFDLEGRPPFRSALFARGDREHILLLSIHHIVSDFRSLSVMAEELGQLYPALAQGRALPILEPAPDFRDYLAAQKDRLDREGDRLWGYWSRQLAGPPPLLDLPSSRKRPPALPHPGRSFAFEVPPPVAARLKALARREKTTLYTVLLSAFDALLYRYTGQGDVWVCSPMSGRVGPQVSNLVGYLVNTVVLRGDCSDNPPFVELLRRMRKTVVDAFAHQEYPFSWVVERLHPSREPSRPPLQQVMFVLQQSRGLGREAMAAVAVGEGGVRLELGGLDMEALALENRHAQFDLTLTMAEQDGGLAAAFKYSAALFEEDTIRRLAGHFANLLEGLATDSQRPLRQLPLLSGQEQRALTAPSRPWPAPQGPAALHRRFERRAQQAPEATAVSCAGQRLTYRQLDERANRLARHLQALGVRKGDRVGLLMERSVEALVAIVGIVKTGAAYLPIDTVYPLDRARFMLQDSDARALVTVSQRAPSFTGLVGSIVSMDRDWPAIAERPDAAPEVEVGGDDIAYVIYTSGSTGQPKGVRVSHHNVARLFDATGPWFRFDARDIWSLFHSFAFDVSVWEIWGALTHGAHLVVVPYLVSRTPESFHQLLREQNVTILTQTPSAFRPLMKADAEAAASPSSLRFVVFCGEALSLPSLLPWFERHGDQRPQMINMYGITETTVHSSYRVITQRDAVEDPGSMIGVAIPDLALYVMDADLQPVPYGVAGEIVVGGDGVAQGYLKRPELTQARFVPDLHRPGATLYRSGDLARLWPNGDLEYLGRMDHQVKIRGFRVELGELESALVRHPGVREAVVTATADEGSGQRLAAYVVPREGEELTEGELLEFLRASLPEYMVPSAFVFLPRLPLTPNGKVDRKALPRPGGVRPTLNANFVPPSTDAERLLAGICGEVLGIQQIGIDDNFFDLGGDSIRSLQVVAKVRERGWALAIQDVFEWQTVRRIAAHFNQAGELLSPNAPFALLSPEDRAKVPPGVVDAYPLSTLMAGLLFHSDFDPDYERYLTSFAIRGRFDRLALERTLERVTRRHAIFRSAFDVSSFSVPMHLVYADAKVPLEVVDLQGKPPHEQQSTVASWIEREKHRQPEWAKAPLTRMIVFVCSSDSFHLIFCEPFLDGWSASSFWAELLGLYSAILQGEPPPVLPEPALSYGDFVGLERRTIASPESKAFFARLLQDAEPSRMPRLPRLQGTEAPRRHHTERYFEVPAKTFEGLKAFARRYSLPLKSVLLAAHVRVVGLASGRRDVLTGFLQNGRPEGTGGDQIYGMFLNTLPIRQQLRGGTWVELAQAVFAYEQACLPHRRYPLAQLQKEVFNGQPFLDTACNFTQFHMLDGLRGLRGIEVQDFATTDQTYLFFMATYNLDVSGSRMLVALDCNGPTPEQAASIQAHYLNVFAAMAESPASRYDDTAKLLADEQRRIAGWNRTAAPFPSDRCYHQLFEQKAAETPEAIAAAGAARQLTYRELNARANGMARFLVEQGVGPEQIVPVRAQRGLDLLTAMLAVNKAGGAFLPLDPHSPPRRLGQILAQCRARLVIADQQSLAEVREALEHGLEAAPRLVHLEELCELRGTDQNLAPRCAPENLAYVMFTSGSTGVPKGALVEQRGMVNHLFAKNRDLGLGPQDVLAQTAAQSFDIFVFQNLSALLEGARTQIVLDESALVAEQLAGEVRRHGITVVNLVPSQLRTLVEEASRSAEARCALAGLRWVVPTGEPLPPELCRQWFSIFPEIPLLNAYGHTECSDDQAHHPMTAPPPGDVTPIGRPIQNMRFHVLDGALQPVAIGVPGELYIGGTGVGRGYLGDEAKTAEKFIADPFSPEPGARFYRTGDLGRWLPNGLLEVSGRSDFMVKVRGLRVELGEIEAALSRQPAIREAVAMVREAAPGRKSLVAYLVARPGESIVEAELRARLREQLPEHMVPAAFVVLPALPLTRNGKVDRRALPAPALKAAAWEPPRAGIEEALAGLFAQLLRVERVGRGDVFFELGGDSLLATQVIARARKQLGVQVGVRDLFEAPTVAQLAARIEAMPADSIPEPEPLRHAPGVPLQPSFAQQRMAFLAQLDPSSASYNVANAIRIQGDLDVPALQRSWAEAVRRHEVLRSTFPQRSGETAVEVAASVEASIRLEDCEGATPQEREADALRRATAEVRRPFDLGAGPLWRVTLLRLSAREHLFVLVVHHIVSDGWSAGILVAEISALYRAFSHGAPSPLAEPSLQYSDYAAWQRRWLRGEVLERELAYWRRQLAQLPQSLELPADHPRPRTQSLKGGAVQIQWTPELTSAIRALAQRENATPFMVVLAALQLLLFRWTGQEDVCVGAPIAGRIRPELEPLVGFFANTLVLRGRLSPQLSFEALVRQARETTLDASAHQAVPFEKLVEELRPERDLSRTPFFQILFAWQHAALPEVPGLTFRPIPIDTATSKFDLTLALADFAPGVGLSGTLEYDSALFEPETATRLVHQLTRLLEAAVRAPQTPISRLPLLSATEQAELLAKLRGESAQRSGQLTAHRLFEQQAERTPNAVAVSFAGSSLTYAELDGRANAIAQELRRRGVGPDDRVGLLLERSLDMPACLLGTLKAGAAYVALDPAYPLDRLRYMLEESGAKVLIVQPSTATLLPAPGPTLISIEALATAHSARPSEPGAGASNLAYVIFTSGSTGRPKGVAMPHGPLVNLLLWQRDAFLCKGPRKTLQLASFSFDMHFTELFSAWTTGGEAVVVPEKLRRDGRALARLVAEQGIERLLVSFSFLQELAEAYQAEGYVPERLGEVVSTAEPLRITRAVRWLFGKLAGCVLHNQYGPSETHVVTMETLQGSAEAWPAAPSIGHPIANAQALVLDDSLMPVPAGVVGELYLGGEVLARGYLGRPELTAQKFVPSPFGRLYRTGDRARLRRDGALECLGRVDDQIKIRGVRIEPAEIEAAIARHPGVESTVVVARRSPGQESQLAAYFLSRAKPAPEPAELRRFLLEVLPEFMIPPLFMEVASFSRTPSGKIDRRALPEPAAQPGERGKQFVQPTGSLERWLAFVWQDLLGVERVGAHDDFFELGGHSLVAVRLMNQVQAAHHVELPLRTLFETPTVAGLAARLLQEQGGQQARAATSAQLPAVVPAPEAQHQPFPLTDVQQAYWIGRSESFELGNVATHGYSELDCSDLDLERLEAALRGLIARHGMLRAVVLPSGEQQILPEVPPYRVKVSDLRSLDGAARAAELERVRAAMSHQMLDAGQWPIFEVRASRLDEHRSILHLSFDALLADAWSLDLLGKELMALYQDPAAQLPALSLSFRDYVLAERSIETTELYQRSLAHWRGRLPTLPPAPQLPLAKAPGSVKSPRFVRRSTTLDRDTWSRLRTQAARAGLTPSGVLLAAYARVLATWSKNSQFTVNLTLFNRLPLHPQVDALAGDFTSLILLAVDFSKRGSFETRARQLQQQLWEDLEHRYVSGVKVLRELARTHGEGAQAAMPVVFTSTLGFETSHPLELGTLAYSITQTSQVWLDHQVREVEGVLHLNWDAVEELFPAGMLDAMFTAYCRLLGSLADDPGAWRVEEETLVPEAQLAQRRSVNATEAPSCRELLHERFEKRAAEDPSRIAVIDSRRQLTYQELLWRSTQLAHRLRQAGARPNRLVAVAMEKGWEQVVAVVGILQAGAAYLPIDPKLPGARIRYLLENGEIRQILTQSWLAEKLPGIEGVERICVDGLPPPSQRSLLEPVATPDDLAYVIYTSGSTGQPKGVMIDHRGALNTVLDINDRFTVGPEDRVLALSALNFDLSVYDVFGTLAAGAAVVLPDDAGTREPAHWAELMARHRVSIWNSVPTLMQMLVESTAHSKEMRESLRVVMLSGDWIPVGLPDQIRSKFPRATMASLGGATEASIWSILYPIGDVDPSWPSIPYGRPMRNQRFEVLNGKLEPCPVWTPGELFIGGTGVAKGYWRDEERTAARFITHPRTREYLYRTGDLGRYLPDGTIQFIGREDSQVKIQGHRIELGEIEATVERHPDLQAAVVLAHGDTQAGKRLIAYVVPRQKPAEAEDARFSGTHLVDKTERLAFRTSQPGLRRLELPYVELPDPRENEDWKLAHLARRSERQFAKRPVSLASLRGLLKSLGPQGGTLRVLLHAREGGVEGLAPGLYAWESQPATLSAVRGGVRIDRTVHFEGNRSIFDGSAFSLFFVSSGSADAAAEERRPMAGPDDRLSPVSLDQLSGLLSHLSQVEVGGMPKYGYPSAGHLYPVQVYLDVRPGGVLGLEGGGYYYHPRDARLIRLSAENLAAPAPGTAPFALYLVADIAAIRPMYGALSRDFSLLEAGCMTQLLAGLQHRHNLAFSPAPALSLPRLREAFRLEDGHILLAGFGAGDHREPAAGGAQLSSSYAATLRDQQLLDVGAAEQRLMMDAPGTGIGVCVIGAMVAEAVRSALSLSAGEELLSSILGGAANADIPGPWSFPPIANRPSDTDLAKSVRAHVRERLPEHMVPAQIIVLDHLPLSSNGKIDRKALPLPEQGPARTPHLFVAPRDPLEVRLAALWSELLERRRPIGVFDNFFELGGNSLIAVRLVSQLERELGKRPSLTALFQSPTIAAFADALRGAAQAGG